ncbi:MAG: HNH endonuclease family protein, partial [Muribaculaceae bacterium]|nr:HNH endonuclease family protein [Muribaculaceae bacterium]
FSTHMTDHAILRCLVGSAMCIRDRPLSKIYEIWRNGESPAPLAKNEFLSELDRLISESLGLKSREELAGLDYNANKDRLQKVLLLFNVETERLMDEGKRRFPFDRHKDKNVKWSLEHIHAQKAESLQKNKDIQVWLESHFSLLQSPENNFIKADDELIEKMTVLIDQLRSGKDPGNVRERFNEIQQEVTKLFTPKDDVNKDDSYLHGIANMALLDAAQNAALSNSVFDVKRCRVIGYDKDGKYIPICTKHVFFKYYTPSNPSPIFWGQSDRDNYVEAIEEKISPYYSGVEGDAEENADGEND